jgi:hypothetical protein
MAVAQAISSLVEREEGLPVPSVSFNLGGVVSDPQAPIQINIDLGPARATAPRSEAHSAAPTQTPTEPGDAPKPSLPTDEEVTAWLNRNGL